MEDSAINAGEWSQKKRQELKGIDWSKVSEPRCQWREFCTHYAVSRMREPKRKMKEERRGMMQMNAFHLDFILEITCASYVLHHGE